MEKPQFSAMVEEKRAFFISMGVLVFLACMYGILGSTRWAVDPIQSATNFCEGISDGLVKEPMNALSNLTYVFVGLFILWNMPPSKANTANPMLGRGMLFFISFPVYYNLARQYQWTDRFFATVFFTVFALTALLDTYATSNNLILIENFSDDRSLRLSGLTRDYLWSLYIGTWIIQETKNLTENRIGWMIALPLIACVTLSVGVPFLQIIILCALFIAIAYLLHSNPGHTLVREPSPHLWIGVACYVVANVVWRFGHSDEAACNPDSLFQYHALWHLLTGLSVYFFFRYFATESPVEATELSA